MKKWTYSTAALAVSLAMFGCTSYANAADTIKIAVVGPETGPVAQYGDMEFNGAHAAIEMINKEGGIDGKKLEEVDYDDACEPKQAVAVANRVVNDDIHFVVGHLCSSATQPASDVYEDEGILMVTPASTSPAITTRGYQMIFRTIGLDSDQGPTAGKYIIEHIKPKRVAIVHDKQQYGEGIATAVKASLDKAGVKVVSFDGITSGTKDFSALIAKLKQEKADFVYYGGYHPELGLILRQSAEKGFKAQFMGPEGVGNKDLSAIAGKASEGLIVTLPKKYDKSPENAKIVQLLQSEGKDPSGPFVWTSYAAVQTIASAIKAKGDDPEAAADYLRSHSVKTVMGPLSWNQKGDLKGFSFGVFRWHADATSTELQ
ncbi:branched-chain amino acid ABC transporter substrate-binding protein [Celerinatantimonas diazotrophica]|uniref:L-leucine-binding protein /L-isoleucine-binding protein /L-valine-binding protein n=1 Tax=Celerinatantimonas diazotrophica TaxID=412034 RepID=A0A4R1J849_9GAMM|nr:branched-chain amino acid ABC transporter substrate-binding protein [Celerinatantimonas diazotrophica]TCK46745.1 L-leucine-binding protein /L-isoleucine-binding protein /L-valine-binding protein [Celerinatantimonas diazotrophica]CAG9295448.1 Leu/Ile/Val/Thr-binding protein [Celerinatantimonas diazotrophica]